VTRRLALRWKRREIDAAAVATEALAREIFGNAAYLRREVDAERETGEQYIVFEVHYCFADAENQFDLLSTLHNEFMDGFVRATSRDISYLIHLRLIPVKRWNEKKRLRETISIRRTSAYLGILGRIPSYCPGQ
jgi:hypothetical protein